jgi:hypothetical protein
VRGSVPCPVNVAERGGPDLDQLAVAVRLRRLVHLWSSLPVSPIPNHSIKQSVSGTATAQEEVVETAGEAPCVSGMRRVP